MLEQVKQIREHALENYELGWDVVVEAYEDKDILELLEKHSTVQATLVALEHDINLNKEYHLGLSDF